MVGEIIQHVIQSSSSLVSTIITPDSLRQTDVLCGRNKAALSSIGNRAFRVSLALYIPRYEAARTKLQKSSVIFDICNIFRHDVGVRFLKKYHHQQHHQQHHQHSNRGRGGEGAEGTGKTGPMKDKDNYYYMELSEKEIKKKVGHALRDMSVARRQVFNEKQQLGVLTKDQAGTSERVAQTSAPSSSSKTRKRDNGNDDDERNQLVSSINRMAEADAQRLATENRMAVADRNRAEAEAERARTSGIVIRTSVLVNLTNLQIKNEDAISKCTLLSFDAEDTRKKELYLSLADKAQRRYDILTAEMEKLSDTSTNTNTNTNINTNT